MHTKPSLHRPAETTRSMNPALDTRTIVTAEEDAAPSLRMMLGAMAGDALGVPFEFKRADQIPPAQLIDMDMSAVAGFSKTYAGVPYGTWSDDGSHALCLLEALLACNSPDDFTAAAFMRVLDRWWQQAYHQAGGKVFDVGGATSRALAAYARNPQDWIASLSDDSKGNGALMRAMAVPAAALARGWDVAAVVSLSLAHTRATHPGAVCMVCSALYALTLFRQAQQDSKLADVFEHAQQELRSLLPSPALQQALDEILSWRNANMPTGSGYVVDSFWTAMLTALRAGGYRETLQMVISFGNDTDTCAAIAGALAVRHGNIPRPWLDCMSFPAESVALLARL